MNVGKRSLAKHTDLLGEIEGEVVGADVTGDFEEVEGKTNQVKFHL